MAIALSLLVAEVAGPPFHNTVMTFSSTPELHAVQGASLAQKVRLIRLLGPLLCTKVNLEGASESCANAAQQSLTLTPVRMLLVDISSGSEGGASSASPRPSGNILLACIMLAGIHKLSRKMQGQRPQVSQTTASAGH